VDPREGEEPPSDGELEPEMSDESDESDDSDAEDEHGDGRDLEVSGRQDPTGTGAKRSETDPGLYVRRTSTTRSAVLWTKRSG
jgi:hypothetical protein